MEGDDWGRRGEERRATYGWRSRTEFLAVKDDKNNDTEISTDDFKPKMALPGVAAGDQKKKGKKSP